MKHKGTGKEAYKQRILGNEVTVFIWKPCPEEVSLLTPSDKMIRKANKRGHTYRV